MAVERTGLPSESIRNRAQYDGCTNRKDEGFPDLNLDRCVGGVESTVTKFVRKCEVGGSTELWSIVGGGHVPCLSSDFSRLVIEWMFAHPKPGDWNDLGNGLGGAHGVPQMIGTGGLAGGDAITLSLSDSLEDASTFLVVGLTDLDAPFRGGVLVPFPDAVVTGLTTDASGMLILGDTWPEGLPSGLPTWYQFWIEDAAGPSGLSASNALQSITP